MLKLCKYHYVGFFSTLLDRYSKSGVGEQDLGMSQTCLSDIIKKHWPHTHCKVSGVTINLNTGVNLVNYNFVCEWNWTHSWNCNDWYWGLVWYPLFCHVLFIFGWLVCRDHSCSVTMSNYYKHFRACCLSSAHKAIKIMELIKYAGVGCNILILYPI